MTGLNLDYLDKLVNRFKGYKSPTDTQKLIMFLAEKPDRTEEDVKKLIVLVRAERAAEKLHTARQATRDLLNREKKEIRRVETRKKILWGAALLNVQSNNQAITTFMTHLYENDFFSEKDKLFLKDDYEALKKTLNY